MGGYFPALAVNPPPNLGDELARAVQLRSLVGQQQLQQIQIQNAQADQQAYKAANQQWQPNAQGQYDHNDFIDLMRKNGATAQTVLGLQQAQLKMDETAALTRKNNLEAAAQQSKIDADNHEKTAADLENLKPANTPPEKYEAARDRQLQQWVQSGRMSAQEASQYANTPQSAVEGLQKHVLGLKTYSDVQKAQAETEKNIQDANLAKMKAGPIDVDTSNQRATARYQQYHPNQALPTYLTLPQGANLLQEELRDKNLEALEKAEAIKQNTAATREATAAQRGITNEMAQARLAQGEERISQKDSDFIDKNYVKPANDIEEGYQKFQSAKQDYDAGAKTGAASMVALSQHLATTFGSVKGARLNKDLIAEHKDAIGWTDRLERFGASISSGQQLSKSQWEDYQKLISNTRKIAWDVAQKEANRRGVDISDSLPDDLKRGGGAGPSSATPTAISRPANATHTGVGSVDKKKHWLDAQGKDLGVAE